MRLYSLSYFTDFTGILIWIYYASWFETNNAKVLLHWLG